MKKVRYGMPAEWEIHDRSFVSWPVKDSMVWPENYEEVCEGYGEVVDAIASFEPVTVIVNPGDGKDVLDYVGADDNIALLEIEHDDAWVRDNGPTFIWNDEGEVAAVDWQFNAWGGKYSPWDLDNELAAKVADAYEVPVVNEPFIMEGGSIHVDGEGTLLTTEECLLNRNRNPQMDRLSLEKALKRRLNLDTVIWLKRGLFGDETDGHVDNVACFAKPGVVLLQTCHDEKDPNYEITLENLAILGAAKDSRGRSIEVIEIPNPPYREYNGKRLTLSYLNFYFVNDGIILPVFGGDASETDAEAAAVLRRLFPERRIVEVDGMKLIKEGGNVHCITQQMPRRRTL